MRKEFLAEFIEKLQDAFVAGRGFQRTECSVAIRALYRGSAWTGYKKESTGDNVVVGT